MDGKQAGNGHIHIDMIFGDGYHFATATISVA